MDVVFYLIRLPLTFIVITVGDSISISYDADSEEVIDVNKFDNLQLGDR